MTPVTTTQTSGTCGGASSTGQISTPMGNDQCTTPPNGKKKGGKKY